MLLAQLPPLVELVVQALRQHKVAVEVADLLVVLWELVEWVVLASTPMMVVVVVVVVQVVLVLPQQQVS